MSTDAELDREALEAIAAYVPIYDEWDSAADFMEYVAEILDVYGVPRPDHYPED